MAVIAGVAQAQDYRVYASNEYDVNVTVIDPKTETAIGSINISGRPGDVRPRGMAVSPDGKIVYISVSDFLPRSETPEDAIVCAITGIRGPGHSHGHRSPFIDTPASTV